MILTDKEILELLPSWPNVTWGDWHIVNKAQLKKVVELAEDYVCVDCSTPNFVHLVIPLRDWQVLLEGVK